MTPQNPPARALSAPATLTFKSSHDIVGDRKNRGAARLRGRRDYTTRDGDR